MNKKIIMSSLYGKLGKSSPKADPARIEGLKLIFAEIIRQEEAGFQFNSIIDRTPVPRPIPHKKKKNFY